MYVTPNTALEIFDNAEELELICIQLEEEKENNAKGKSLDWQWKVMKWIS